MRTCFSIFLVCMFWGCSAVHTDDLTIAVPSGAEGDLIIQQAGKFCREQNIENVTYIRLPAALYDLDDEFIDSYLRTPACADIIPLKNCWTAPLTGMLEVLDSYQSEYDLDMHLDSYIRNNYFYDNTLYSKLVALPYSADPYVMYINRELSEKYGFDTAFNFDQLEAQCLEVIQKEKDKGKKVNGLIFDYQPEGRLFETVYDFLQLAGGGTIVNESYQSSINNSAARNLFKSLSRWAGNIAPEFTEKNRETLLDMIQNNEALYVFAPVSFSLHKKNTFFAKYRFSESAYDGTFNLTARGYSYGVKRHCHRSVDAVKIIYFISSPEQQRLRFDKGFAFPTSREFYSIKNKNNKGLENIMSGISMSESCISKDLVSNYFYVRELFIDALMPCLADSECGDVANSFEYELLHLYNSRF